MTTDTPPCEPCQKDREWLGTRATHKVLSLHMYHGEGGKFTTYMCNDCVDGVKRVTPYLGLKIDGDFPTLFIKPLPWYARELYKVPD